MCVFFTVLTLIGVNLVHADALVVAASDNVTLRVGDIIPKNRTIKADDGARIVVLMGDALHSIEPGERLDVQDVPSAHDLDRLSMDLRSILTTWRDLEGVKTLRGGGGGDLPPDPWLLDVQVDATHCVKDNEMPALWSPAPLSTQQAVIIDRSSEREVFFAWPAGQDRIPWPADGTPADGSRYVTEITGDRRRFSFWRIGGNDLSLFLAMLEKGCHYQIYRIMIRGAF